MQPLAKAKALNTAAMSHDSLVTVWATNMALTYTSVLLGNCHESSMDEVIIVNVHVEECDQG